MSKQAKRARKKENQRRGQETRWPAPSKGRPTPKQVRRDMQHPRAK
jgi:hypothetical protein